MFDCEPPTKRCFAVQLLRVGEITIKVRAKSSMAISLRSRSLEDLVDSGMLPAEGTFIEVLFELQSGLHKWWRTRIDSYLSPDYSNANAIHTAKVVYSSFGQHKREEGIVEFLGNNKLRTTSPDGIRTKPTPWKPLINADDGPKCDSVPNLSKRKRLETNNNDAKDSSFSPLDSSAVGVRTKVVGCRVGSLDNRLSGLEAKCHERFEHLEGRVIEMERTLASMDRCNHDEAYEMFTDAVREDLCVLLWRELCSAPHHKAGKPLNDFGSSLATDFIRIRTPCNLRIFKLLVRNITERYSNDDNIIFSPSSLDIEYSSSNLNYAHILFGNGSNLLSWLGVHILEDDTSPMCMRFSGRSGLCSVRILASVQIRDSLCYIFPGESSSSRIKEVGHKENGKTATAYVLDSSTWDISSQTLAKPSRPADVLTAVGDPVSYDEADIDENIRALDKTVISAFKVSYEGISNCWTARRSLLSKVLPPNHQSGHLVVEIPTVYVRSSSLLSQLPFLRNIDTTMSGN